jgi:hypothetical protein
MIDTISKMDAIQSLRPNAQLVTRGDVIEWMDDVQTQPTDAEITAEMARLQGIYDSQEYARARATEYSALNQFEMQFDDQQNNTTTWVDAINDIKARFPK